MADQPPTTLYISFYLFYSIVLLGNDRVGYKSIHLVVTYPERLTELPEYAKFEGLYIEIQITCPQHPPLSLGSSSAR